MSASRRISCKLCSCEGVRHTRLCEQHLEGFEYACLLLATDGHPKTGQALRERIVVPAQTSARAMTCRICHAPVHAGACSIPLAGEPAPLDEDDKDEV